MVTAILSSSLPAIEELRSYPQWVAWRSAPRASGKAAKVPITPATRLPARVDDRSTWSTWEAARAAGGRRGIGFVLTAADPFTVIDVDNCRHLLSGRIEPWADEYVVRALASYAEASPSGCGVHVWVRGVLPAGGRRWGRIEMYDTGRFVTVTGHVLPGVPRTIESRQAELELLHRRVFGVRASIPSVVTSPITPFDDDHLLELAHRATNGEKFRRLWAGDRMGYASPSEADLALCRLLVFWTGSDPSRVDRLFRRSGLMRAKWNEARGRETYGARTLRVALGGSSGE
jgi:putative DNA primase/helicase